METAITTVIRRARAWSLGMMCRGASYSCSLSPGRRMWPGVMYWGVTTWVIFGQTSNTWYLRSKKRFRLGLRRTACWDDCAHCGTLVRTPGYVVLEISTWCSGGPIWPNLGGMVLRNDEWERTTVSISWMRGSMHTPGYAREDAWMYGSRDPDFGFLSEIDMCYDIK